MAGTHLQVFIHLVWGTYQRMPLIEPDVERAVYRCIQSSVRRNQAIVLALGGVADHVHLLIALPTTVTLAKLVQDVKGLSSHVGRHARGEEGFFRWQHGFGAYSVDESRLDIVRAYVRDQKRHHAEGTIRDEWEDAGPSDDIDGLE